MISFSPGIFSHMLHASNKVIVPPPCIVLLSGRIHLRWNVNGQQSKFAAHALDSVADIISLKTPLYPTVSLLSGDTRVWCR